MTEAITDPRLSRVMSTDEACSSMELIRCAVVGVADWADAVMVIMAAEMAATANNDVIFFILIIVFCI